MHIGADHLRVDGHAHLGDPSILAQFHETAGGANDFTPEPTIPYGDAQLAVLTLAIRDLTDAIRDSTDAVVALTARLNQPPWYTRLWAALRAFIRQES